MLDFLSTFLSEGANIIWFMILLPVALGFALWLFGKQYIPQLILAAAGAAANLLFAVSLDGSNGFAKTFPFASHGLDIAIGVSGFPALFLLLAAAGFLPVILYSVLFAKGKPYAGRLLLLLQINLALANGAFLSDNLGIMLFFWEGLLATLFGLLLLGNAQKPQLAVKGLLLSGIANLLLMLGIVLTVWLAGTPEISQMPKLPLTGLSGLALACLVLGAAGMAGSLPFHSWIPDAADGAPIPFMAAMPGLLSQLLGIFLAVRAVSVLFDVRPGDAMSLGIMALGALTAVLAALMALAQTDIRRFLAYQTISQTGLMLLGIGTALPAGIVGGLFHLLIGAAGASCLFMSAGRIEKRTGTADLRQMGSLYRQLPVTAICFVISGLSVIGVPPLGGFFSLGLVLDAALETSAVFFVCALLGILISAAAFLKACRLILGGKPRLTAAAEDFRKPGIGLSLPMIAAAVPGLLFGLFNTWPLDGILRSVTGGDGTYARWPHSAGLTAALLGALLLAAAGVALASGKSGGFLTADPILEAPGLKAFYQAAAKRQLDPYTWITRAADGYAWLCSQIERGVSWFYDEALVRLAKGAGDILHRFSNGSLSRYLALAVAGVACILIGFLIILL